MAEQLALVLDPSHLTDEQPDAPEAVRRLRLWLGEQGIRDCRCGYFWAESDYEARWLTGRDGETAGYVRTTIDLACRHHGLTTTQDDGGEKS